MSDREILGWRVRATFMADGCRQGEMRLDFKDDIEPGTDAKAAAASIAGMCEFENVRVVRIVKKRAPGAQSEAAAAAATVTDDPPLGLYHLDETDYVIAASAGDAWSLLAETCGIVRADFHDDDLNLCPPNMTFSAWQDPDGSIGEQGDTGAVLVEKTVAAWIAGLPRGFFCSTEY